jgi:hypothetical protein
MQRIGILLITVAACGDNRLAPNDAAIEPDAPSCGAPRTVFLNRGGGTYTAGPDDSSSNTSSILTATATLPAPTVVEADWTSFVACVKTKFAPFNVVFTEVDPGASPHTELVVIDKPSQIGVQNGVASISPLKCAAAGLQGALVEQAIVFMMWSAVAASEHCYIGAQTLANSFGLDHEFSCPDLMTFLSSCGPSVNKTFTDADVPCGEASARACTCGASTQNSFQYLTATLGAACP